MASTFIARGELVPLPPDPPPHPYNSAIVRIARGFLPDFINTDSRRDQRRIIGPALQVPHVSPFLYNEPVRFDLEIPATRISLCLPKAFMVLARIGAQKYREVRIGPAIPGDAEYHSCSRNIFPNEI